MSDDQKQPSEVIINGVRYIPDPNVPDRVSFWYMHDGHYFTRLQGNTIDEVIAHADAVEAESPWGMLCPATLLSGGREIRRVGTGAHSSGSGDSASWRDGKRKWREAVESDPDIARLLAARKESA